MVAGRPREYDRVLIAQQMMEWVAKDDSINLCGFCADYWIPYSRMWAWAQEDKEFRDILEMIRLKIAQRREQWVSEKRLHQTAYGLNARVYDRPMHQYYREDSKYQSDLKKEEGATIAPETANQFENMMNQIKKLQEASNTSLISLANDNASS